MAQGSSGQRQRGPAGQNRPGPGGNRPVRRTSVAAARKSTGNRTQLILGGIAIVLIIAVIVVGLVLNRKNNAVQDAGYGASTQSVVTLDNGVQVVAAPNAQPKVTLDVYEDPLCPYCAAFEHQFGQQIAKQIDQGNLKVNYRILDFLNAGSASKTYSTRASAALMCVAQNGGSTPGLWMKYHTLLYDTGVQPEENGKTDLDNAQLAEKAKSVGADQAAQSCISSGKDVDLAKTESTASQTLLKAATGGKVGTPTVLHDGKIVDTTDTGWLTKLMA